MMLAPEMVVVPRLASSAPKEYAASPLLQLIHGTPMGSRIPPTERAPSA